MRHALRIGLVPLFMICAFALAAAAAQAAPHYYRNNVLIGSEPIPIITWGTETWRTTKGDSGVWHVGPRQ